MKRKLIVSAILTAVLQFSGCDSSDSASVYGTNERMVTNVPYVVNSGDEIENISVNPEIKMESDLTSNKTTITLISGEASIIRK